MALASSSGDAGSDPDDNFDKVKNDLTAVLHHVNTGATEKFATSAPFKTVESPGLYVSDVGSIGLPLSDRDAKELIQVCHRAPFGKGSDTIIDMNVRKTWELNPSHFSLRNPQWQKTLSGLVDSAAQDLGLVGRQGPRAELYKLLLYEEGAFFDRHKDSEKAPGMFGTLVIALPSPHRGGQIVANFGGQVKHLNTEAESDYGYSYLAWYADVEHSVMPVTSGYRLVLTYNLIASDTIPLSILAAESEGNMTKVSNILSEWKTRREEVSDQKSVLAYILDHEYTKANLRPGLLKGRDREKWRILGEACKKQQCLLYLAQLTFERSGECEYTHPHRSRYYSNSNDDVAYHEIIDECDTSINLPFVCDESGGEVATNCQLRTSDVVQKGAFDCEPDDEDYSGWTGNEGVSTTHYYRRACMVVLSLSGYVDFVYDSERGKDPTLGAWVAKLQRSDDAEANLERLCSRVLEDAAVKTIASASLAYAWPTVFSKVASRARNALPPNIYCELGAVVARDSLSMWQTAIEKAYKSICSIRSYLEANDHMVEGYKRACAAKGKQPSDLPFLDRDIRDNVLTTLDQGKEHDAATLILMSLSHGEFALSQKIVPYLKSQTSQSGFLMEFLSLLRVSHVASEPKKQAYNEILKEFAHQFRFELLAKQEHTSYWCNHDQPPRAALDKSAFADLLFQSLAFGAEDPVNQILEKIEIGAWDASSHTFEAGIFPFMTSTVEKALEDTSSAFPRLFCGLIDACIHQFVGSYPPKPQDWIKKASGCSCKHCKAMDKFLSDPRQKQIRLERFQPYERNHLIHRLHSDDCNAELDESVKPQVLVLTKTLGAWQKDRDSWASRRKKMLNFLKGLADRSSMKKLLGNQYARLFIMSDIKIPSDQHDPPSGPVIVQTKREIEKVDVRHTQEPQPKPQAPAKRPLSGTQAIRPPHGVGAKRPRSEQAGSFIDLTDE